MDGSRSAGEKSGSKDAVLPNDALQRMKRGLPNYASVLYKEGSRAIRIVRIRARLFVKIDGGAICFSLSALHR